MKRCSRCLVLKDVDGFNVRVIASDGLHTVCRECVTKRKRELYAAATARQVTVTQKKCSNCSEIKLPDQFPRHKVSSDGLGSRCRKCHNAAAVDRKRKLASTIRVSEKKCAECEKIKPADLFIKSKSERDGLSSYCKHCQAMRQRRRYATTNREVTVKIKFCKKCGSTKKADEFGKHRLGKDGLNTQCKRCKSDNRMRRVYKISHEKYDQLLLMQDNACAICGVKNLDSNKKFAVDHDHSCCPGNRSCGECIRAILCANCNAALGLFKDDPQIAISAAKYLLKFSLNGKRVFFGFELPAGVLE